MSFEREGVVLRRATVALDMLPDVGSDHEAFVEMGFVWGELNTDDPYFRHVTMPDGFTLEDGVSPVLRVIQDADTNTRAVVTIPEYGRPYIKPTKRFTIGIEESGDRFIGYAEDWNDKIFRTPPMADHVAAAVAAQRWLDDTKPGWRSYVDPINFMKKPTLW